MEWKVRALTPTEQLDNAIQELKSQAAGDLEEHFEATRGPFSILFGKIISWSQATQQFLRAPVHHAVLLVEHRQIDTDELESQFQAAGYHISAHSAVIKEVGLSSGVAIATKSYLGSKPQPVGGER